MAGYRIQKFPKTRIATVDIGGIGKQKHHVTGMLELDVTESRAKIHRHNQGHENKISFTGWLISTIGSTVGQYDTAAAYLKGKRKLVIFDDINISMIIEKELEGQKVPIPLIIEKADKKSAEAITLEISAARDKILTGKDIVLRRKTSRMESFYYHLPGFLRRQVWRLLLKHPHLAFNKMGNVAFTSIGMMGKVNGWFIPTSVHPVCFGISSVIKKPVAINQNIEIREMLNLTILLDHDVMDGAPMARFIRDLSGNIENGKNL